MDETFSIEFDGPAFEDHRIPVTALAQSLLALDGLAKRVASEAYGKDYGADVKVKAGFKPGSFIVDLIIESFTKDPVAASAGLVTIGIGAVSCIKGLIKLGKWAFGEKVKVIEDKHEAGEVKIENTVGDVCVFNQMVVNIYNNARTQSQLSRLTQTLDMDGADQIRIINDPGDNDPEIITKEHRRYFRHEEGIVLTDNESEVILEVVGPMLNGNPKGWTFSEGEDGIEFIATVEDEKFLSEVVNREVVLVNGSMIRAIVRTVQHKNVRTRTDRTIIEVKEVLPPEE